MHPAVAPDGENEGEADLGAWLEGLEKEIDKAVSGDPSGTAISREDNPHTVNQVIDGFGVKIGQPGETEDEARTRRANDAHRRIAYGTVTSL